jgi:AcrR family transcriptional regulator
MAEPPSSDKYLRRKAEVRLAAARLFRRHSFSGTSMDMLAAELGLNKGTLYHYYKRKPDILYDIIIGPMRELAGKIDEIPLDAPLPDQIARIVDITVTQTSDWEDQVAVYFQESRYLDQWFDAGQLDALRKYEGRYAERLRLLLRQGRSTGEVIDIDPVVVRNALAGMTGFLSAWYDPGGRISPAELAKMFATLVLNGLIAR